MPAFRHGGIVYRVHSYSGDMSVQCIVMSAYRNNETMAERVLELLEGGGTSSSHEDVETTVGWNKAMLEEVLSLR